MRYLYFDNAATTLIKPREAIKKTLKFIQNGYANAGRSGHYLSMKTAEEIFESRQTVCNFLCFDRAQNVIFTQNATYALNQAIKGMIPNGAHVITSTMEHNSVLRPLYAMQQSGTITLSHFSHRGNIEQNIRDAVTKNTKAIVCSLTSNVTGESIPISLLSRLRRELSLLVIVDASQLFAHEKINLSQNPVDVFCSAGHKGAFGMQGVGFALYHSAPPRTIVEGGSGFDSFAEQMPESLPERLEAGTLSAAPIVSLKHGLSFIERIGIEAIEEKLQRLDRKLNEILESTSGIQRLCRGNHGIHSFIFLGKTSSECAAYLEKEGILTRSGFHCAPIIHKAFGTEDTGAVRISFSYFNSLDELDKLYKVLKRMRMT